MSYIEDIQECLDSNKKLPESMINKDSKDFMRYGPHEGYDHQEVLASYPGFKTLYVEDITDMDWYTRLKKVYFNYNDVLHSFECLAYRQDEGYYKLKEYYSSTIKRENDPYKLPDGLKVMLNLNTLNNLPSLEDFNNLVKRVEALENWRKRVLKSALKTLEDHINNEN